MADKYILDIKPFKWYSLGSGNLLYHIYNGKCLIYLRACQYYHYDSLFRFTSNSMLEGIEPLNKHLTSDIHSLVKQYELMKYDDKLTYGFFIAPHSGHIYFNGTGEPARALQLDGISNIKGYVRPTVMYPDYKPATYKQVVKLLSAKDLVKAKQVILRKYYKERNK